MFGIPFYIASRKVSYQLLWLPFLICVFISIDSFFVPGRVNTEFVQDLGRGRAGLRSNASETFWVQTDQSWYMIPEPLYWKIKPNGVLQVERSPISGAQKNMLIEHENNILFFKLSFYDKVFGQLLLIGIMVGICIFSILFKRIDSPHVASKFSIAFLSLALYLLYEHLDLIYLFL